MPRLNLNLFVDDDFEVYADKRLHPDGKPRKTRKAAPPPVELSEQMDGQDSFTFSYNASRHERVWIMESLAGFYEEHWIADILRLLKGGKEASVYQCKGNPATSTSDFIAAKVYRPRIFRSLRKDHIYREGRANLDAYGNVITDDGMLHAMKKRTSYGSELLHSSWIEYEYQTLLRLHAAGADVPVPFARGDNAILMDFIGDADLPAPTLNSVDLDSGEARYLFERVIHNIEIMLEQECIHGDLSAYNLLYWDGEITLIDFPQVVNPYENRNAFRIFERDVTRVCEYFARQGVPSEPRRLAAEMWTAHRYRLEPDVHPALLNDEDEGDRSYYQKYLKS